ncbi:MAG: transposase [Sedimenticola sp.]
MRNRNRIHHRGEVQRFKRAMLQAPGWSLRDLLPGDVLHRLIEQASCVRNTVYTPLVTLGLFIRQVLSDDASCKNIIASFLIARLCAEEDSISVNTGPYCKARYRLPLGPLHELVCKSGEATDRHKTSDSLWRGLRVIMVDGTTALLQDTPENQERYPQSDHQKPGIGFPIIRMVALISLSKATVLDYAINAYQGKGTGESSLFARLLGGMRSGDLLLGDRYYASYGILAALIGRGVAAVMRQHALRKTDFRTGKKLGPRDHIISWDKPKIKPVWADWLVLAGGTQGLLFKKPK